MPWERLNIQIYDERTAVYVHHQSNATSHLGIPTPHLFRYYVVIDLCDVLPVLQYYLCMYRRIIGKNLESILLVYVYGIRTIIYYM